MLWEGRGTQRWPTPPAKGEVPPAGCRAGGLPHR